MLAGYHKYGMGGLAADPAEAARLVGLVRKEAANGDADARAALAKFEFPLEEGGDDGSGGGGGGGDSAPPSIKEMKRALAARKVPTAHVLAKSDLIELYQKHCNQAPPSAAGPAPAPARPETKADEKASKPVTAPSSSSDNAEEPVSYTHLTLPTICSV